MLANLPFSGSSSPGRVEAKKVSWVFVADAADPGKMQRMGMGFYSLDQRTGLMAQLDLTGFPNVRIPRAFVMKKNTPIPDIRWHIHYRHRAE